MQNPREGMDLPQVIFSLVFIFIMIISSLWIMRPFFLGFAWASMVVVATWPIFLKLQILLWGNRACAVVMMTFSLLLVFIIPIVCLVNSLIDNSTSVISWLSSDKFRFPSLEWLQDIPIIGIKLFSSYQKLLNEGGAELITKVQPYMGKTTEFFVIQAGHFGRFILHLIFMLIFSALLYWNGEKVQSVIRHFAIRLGSKSGDSVVLLAGQAIRAVALGVVVTALVQGILSGIGLAISGIPYSSLLMMLIIIFCLVQLGPLPVLIPAIIWLYWNGKTTWGTVLLIWSCVVCILDHILRPILIRIGVDLPTVLILSGVIGGLIAFGMIGLFIGPVVLIISYRLISSWMDEIPAPNSLSKKSVQQLLFKKKN
ncbi:putative membrane protein [Buchnera aphidicola str. Bp (Baizongia pistaciae)]|uniref:Putative transport protein bbp_117 n=1 Tax=Buchnera aphidicola subsp. Baizongia pistaciae (strain Bp) TaxID=224915 RepID=Y117_BUCBP|nr:AI-2E family transporter YdiK [Buchnera aphidicola]Q89AW1.1 RecName: Full=Putative transport protein bbp_117 [Buchnera aphidicola str. Bp (Baizongia pistaciae)]AAO26851.1 putative membrane protein [Buchnera aphidicola str. Bp (Baizongia pistaciae)]